MSKIKFAAKTAKGLKKKKYVPVTSTFITEAGPAVGSIWFDIQSPSRNALIVEIVNEEGTRPVVEYTDGWDDLEEFMQMVASGRYVLVGTTVPGPLSHVQV